MCPSEDTSENIVVDEYTVYVVPYCLPSTFNDVCKLYVQAKFMAEPTPIKNIPINVSWNSVTIRVEMERIAYQMTITSAPLFIQ